MAAKYNFEAIKEVFKNIHREGQLIDENVLSAELGKYSLNNEQNAQVREFLESLELTDEELAYLEEPYVPHPLAGVMAQNKRADASKKHVWTTGAQKILGGEK